METTPPRDPLSTDRARRQRARQVQRRRMVLAVGLLLLIILIVALAVGLSGRGGGTASSTTTTGESTSTTLASATYTAELTGAQAVPALPTKATGSLTLTYNADDKTFTFVVDVQGLTNPSVAKIYEGAPGSAGTAVLTLFAGPTKDGLFSGELVKGTVEATNLTGSLAGMTNGDLIALIEAGGAYVSVGNTSHPIDAIRGQIK